MNPISTISKWAKRGGMGLGLILAGLAPGQDDADTSNPAMEGESFSTEATAVDTEAAPAVQKTPAPAVEAPKNSAPAAPEAETDEPVPADDQLEEEAPEGEVEVIDLQESELEEETWDSSKTRQPQDLSGQVSVEQIVEPPGEYHYASFGRPSPFVPPRLGAMATVPIAAAAKPGDAMGAVTIAGTEIPVVSTLQNYPLVQLELKGIWQLQTGELRAIVMTPEKEGIIVKANDPISAGKVLAIAKDYIMVRQYKLRPDGTREFNDERMTLGESNGAGPQGSVTLLPGKDPEFSTPKAREENLTRPVPVAAPGAVGAVPAKMPIETQPKDGRAPAAPVVK